MSDARSKVVTQHGANAGNAFDYAYAHQADWAYPPNLTSRVHYWRSLIQEAIIDGGNDYIVAEEPDPDVYPAPIVSFDVAKLKFWTDQRLTPLQISISNDGQLTAEQKDWFSLFFTEYDSNFSHVANYTSGSCVGAYPLAQTQGRLWNAIKRTVNVVVTMLVEIVPAALSAAAATGAIFTAFGGPTATQFGVTVGAGIGFWLGFARGVDRINKGNLVCILPPCS